MLFAMSDNQIKEAGGVKFLELGEIDGIELIQKLPIFSQLTFDETTRLGQIAEHQQVAAGEVIIEQGCMGEALYIICEGEVAITRVGEEGQKPEEIGRLQAGDIFGEMSLVDDLLTSASVRAQQSCRLLMLPRDRFQGLIDADAQFAHKVYRSFCRTLSERLRRVNTLLSAAQAFSLGVK